MPRMPSSNVPSSSPRPDLDARVVNTRHPLWWIPSLYTAESLPFAAATLVSVLMYKSFGLSDSSIAFWTSWLLLPWSLKPFFSPLLELQQSKKRVVIVTQACAGVGFGVLVFCLPWPFWFQATLAVLLVVAFNSATHDMAADGLYLDALDVREQAKFVGLQSAFWNIGQVLAQGGLAILAGYLELKYNVAPAWMVVWGILGVMMLGLAAYHWRFVPLEKSAQRQAGSPKPPSATFAQIFQSFQSISGDFFLKKDIWRLIAFSLLFRSAEGQVSKIAQLFLRAKPAVGGLGLSTAEVGFAYGTLGTIGMVVGSMIGGWFAARVGLRRALLPLALIMNVPNVLFTYLAYARPEALWVVSACATLEKFSLGMGFVAMTLVLMQQVAPGKYSTAHLGFATALMGAGLMVPSMISGYISDALGYKHFFVYILIMGLPSILISAFLPLQDQPGSRELPAGEAGQWLQRSAWATALAAGSVYLFIAFSALVTGPLFFGQASSRAELAGFGVVAILGVLLLAAALRHALRLRRLASNPSPELRRQIQLAIGIAAAALAVWCISALGLYSQQRSLTMARTRCAEPELAGKLAACELVCRNEENYAACRFLREQRFAEMAADPDSEMRAALAFDALNRSLNVGCFIQKHAADCLQLGDLAKDPSAWLKANPELVPDWEGAKRYYDKACALQAARGCEQVTQIRAQGLR